ncbi:MAG: polysaccharide biosynthesis C-terminal domain-containing protein [Lachnospiraceae bacterium]|nr:polysaccharide biosynthesis C-terminal domain-containing protein [Lachnospiraceae bacterium]
MYNRDRLVIILISIFLFRIPISHIIGDNGCGYLSGPLEIFWCLMLIFGAGLTITLRGMMHDRVRREQYSNASMVFSFAKRYTFISAFVLLALCILLYNPVSSGLLMDKGCRIAFLFTGPAVFLALFINLNIGYLNGTDNMNYALIGEIIYAIAMGVCMIIGSLVGVKIGGNISALLKNDEVTAMYGAVGAMAGICVGEFVTLIALLAMTLFFQRSFRHMMRSETGRRSEHMGDISGRFLFGVFTDGLQELLLHLPVFVSILLFRRINLSVEGADPAVIGASIGAFYSKFIVIVGIFSILGTIPVQSVLKGIAAAVNDSDTQLAADRITKLLARVAYYAIPATVFITVLAPVIMPTLFTGRITTATSLLGIGASVIFVYAMNYCFISVLIKLGYNREMLVVNAVSLVIGIVISVILAPKFDNGFTGILIGMLICYLLCSIVCVIILLRNFRLRFRLVQYYVIPIVIAGILGILIKLLSNVLYGVAGGVLTLIICVIPAWLIYNIACMVLRVVSAQAIKKKFMGPVLVRIGQSIGIY